MSLNTVTLEFDNKLRTLRSKNCTSPTNETSDKKPLENKPLCLGENIPYADESPERPIIPTRSKPLRNLPRNEMLSSSSTTTSSSTPPNSPAEFLLSPRTLRHHDIDETLIRSSHLPSKILSSQSTKSSQLSQTQSQSIASQIIQPKPPVTPSGASSDETDASTTSNPRDNPPTSNPSITNNNAQTSNTTSTSMRINTEVLREILTDLENKDKMKSIKTKLNRSLSLNYKNHRDDCCCNASHQQHHRQASTTSASNRFSLTKDEKTDKNISKKRQLQDMRNHRHRHTAGNRSIKRRHTVGGTHDYVTKTGNGTGNGGGTPCPGYITPDISSPEWLSRKREMKASHLEQENCRY